jgi:CSLREA domain-containing protein
MLPDRRFFQKVQYLDWQATATVINSTLSGNSASQGGGILDDSDPFAAYDGTLNLTNTIVANSPSGADLQELGISNTGTAQNNLIQSDPTDDVQNGVNGNLIGVDPKLSALGSYGGPTQTFALLPGSPAIQAGTNVGAPTTDQRGLRRPSNIPVDIGAFELETPPTVTGLTPALSGGTLPFGTTSIQVTFSKQVVGADQASNYSLHSTDANSLLGQPDDVIVPLGASYNSATNTATLTFSPLAAGAYRLTVMTAISDVAGNHLNADPDGNAGSNPGSNYIADFVVTASPVVGLTTAGGSNFDVQTGGLGAGQLLQGTNNAFSGLNRLQVGGTDYAPGWPSPASVLAEVVTGSDSASGSGSYADVAGLGSTVSVAQSGTVVRVSGSLDGLEVDGLAQHRMSVRLVVDGTPTADLATFASGNSLLEGFRGVGAYGELSLNGSQPESVGGNLDLLGMYIDHLGGGQLTFEKYLSLGPGSHTVQVQAEGGGFWTDARLTAVDLSPVPTPKLDDTGLTVVTPTQTLAGLSVSREITVPNAGSQDFARTVDSFQNPTASPITTTVHIVGNLGSDAATRVFATSSGDSTPSPNDEWFGTDGGPGTTAVVSIVHGPAGLVPTAEDIIGDNIEWTYTITVQPGQTVKLAAFTIQASSEANAIAEANALVTPTGFGGHAADFLTAADRAALANFAVPGLVVTTTADDTNPNDGQTSLREAIAYADSLGGSQIITFAPAVFWTAQTIALNGTQLPTITDPNLTIAGPGANLLTIDARHNSRIFQVNAGATAAISGLTLTNGFAMQGGAVYNSGTLSLANCTVSGSAAFNAVGGGIFNNAGSLTVLNSTLTGNSAPQGGGGGAIFSLAGTLQVINSTLAGNLSGGGGGALEVVNGTTTLTNCTLVGNSVATSDVLGFGGGLAAVGPTSVTLNNTILAGNTFNGVESDIGNLTASESGDYDLTGDGSAPGAHSIINANPLLSALGYNGGLTQTFALLTGSPALGAGNPALLPNDPATGLPYTTDQRGQPRLRNGALDIGAFEGPDASSMTLTSSSGTSLDVQVVTFTATVAPVAPNGGTVQFEIDGSDAGAPVPLSGGQASFSTASLSAGSHTIFATYSGYAGFSASSATATQQVIPFTAANLQSELTPGSTVTLAATSPGQASVVFAAVNSLSATTPSSTLVVNLEGQTITPSGTPPAGSPPPQVKLQYVNGTFSAFSPALVVQSGQVIVLNSTFTGANATPTILVTGGSLTLRNDIVDAGGPGGSSAPAIEVTGGTLDLGTAADPGMNTLDVNGTGAFVANNTPNAVPQVGDSYQVDGQAAAVWTGGGTDNLWSDPANWQGGSAPVAGDALLFAGTPEPTDNDLVFPAGDAFSSIRILSPSGWGAPDLPTWNLYGNQVVLGGADAIVDVLSPAGESIVNFNLPIQLSSDLTFTAFPSRFEFGGAIDTNGHTFTVNNSNPSSEVFLSGDISGSGGIVEQGGNLYLVGDNSYTGPTLLEAGNCIAGRPTAFGNPSTSVTTVGSLVNCYVQTPSQAGSFVLDSGSILNASAGTTLSGPIVSHGGGILGAATITGPVTVDGYLLLWGQFSVSGNITESTPNSKVEDRYGSVTLSRSCTLTGPMTVIYGATLEVDGTLQCAAVQVSSQSTIKGTGTIDAPVQEGSIFYPPDTMAPGNPLGVLTTGDLSLYTDETFTATLDGPTTGTQYSQLAVNGLVNLGTRSKLQLTLGNGYASALGTSFTIINNEGSGPVNGTFAGLPEGGIFTVNGTEFRITYQGGDGNDVVLTVGAPTTTTIGAPTATYGNPAPITVTVASAAGTPAGNVSLTVDGGSTLLQPLVNGSSTFAISGLAAGDHSLSASYAAQGGYAPSTISGSIHVNQATPTVAVSDAGGGYNGGPYPANATVNGGSTLEGAGLSLSYYPGTYTDPAQLAGAKGLKQAPILPGSYTVQAAFPGSADYTAATALACFSISPPPTAHLTSPTVSQSAGSTTVGFTLTASDPTPALQGGQFTYTINWGDKTSQTVTATATAVPVTHTYSAANAYTVSVTTQDQAGGVSAAATATVVASTAAGDHITVNDPTLAAGQAAGAVWVTWNGATTTYQPTDQVVLAGQGGTDVYTIYFGSTLTTPITLAGSATDGVTVNGSTDPATSNYIVKTPGSQTTITWGPSGGAAETVAYSGILTTNISGGAGTNVITDPGSNTTINGGPGANTIIITATTGNGVVINGGGGTNSYVIDLGSLAGPVTINNSHAGAADNLVVNGAPGDNAITASGNQVTAGAQTITDTAALTSLTVDGGSGNNQLTVSALTVPVQSVTLAGSGTSTTYTVNAGTVNVVAGSGVNTLNVTGGTVASITAPAGDTKPLVFAHSYGVLDNGTLSVPASGVLASDVSANGKALTAVLASGPAHGTLTLNSDGSFSYTPVANFVGSDSFTYQAKGSDGTLSVAAPVTIQVTYHFGGFLAPLNTSQALGLGRTIPIKFQLTDAKAAYITSLSAVTSLVVLNGSGTDVLAGAGKTGLRNDTTANQFIYNWQTKGLTAGTYTVTLALADGTTQTKAVTLSPNGAFQLANGASSGYASSTSDQVVYGMLTVAVQDDSGAGIDPSEQARISDAMSYLNTALGSFGVNLTWAAAGAAADVNIHFASSTPEGGAADGVLGFTTADNDVYLVEGWNFSAAADPTQVGAGQYDFQTLATHELAHTVGLGESSDPGSVMYEYLTPGVARRTFTDANLTAINSDADRFMKVERNDPRTGEVPVWQLTAAAPVGSSWNGQPGRAGGISAWAAALINPSPTSGALPGLVGSGLRADLPAQGGDYVLTGGVGDDLLVGGAGQDLLVGGFAANRPASTGQDALPSRPADDYFILSGGGAADLLHDQGATEVTLPHDMDTGDAC